MQARLLLVLALTGCLVAELDVSDFDDCLDDGDCAVEQACRKERGVRECVTVRRLLAPSDDLGRTVAVAGDQGLEEILLQPGSYTLQAPLEIPDGLSLLGGRNEDGTRGEEMSEVTGPSPTLGRTCTAASRGRLEALHVKSLGSGDQPGVAIRLIDCGPGVVVKDVITTGLLTVEGGSPTLTRVRAADG